MNQYAGMTVNERLFVSGLLKKFDKAITDRDVMTVISILKTVELTDASIILYWRNMDLKEMMNMNKHH